MKHFSRSSWALVLIAVVLTGTFCVSGGYRQNRIKIDAPSYYMYLPATFIYRDLSLRYTDSDPAFFKERTWYNTLRDDTRIIKHTMGMSVMLMPFFFVGHAAAYMSGAATNGYSMPYQNAMSLGVLLYLLLGLHYLRKLLRNYFTENIVALTLLCVVCGTNLLWYVSAEPFMSHGISFSLVCAALCFFATGLKEHSRKQFIYFSITFALLVLIRPALVLLLLFFCISGFTALKQQFNAGSTQRRALLKTLLTGAILMLLIFFPQLLYYKYTTGHWLFNTYLGEPFCFQQPEWLLFLFGFRKGWLLYTPMMAIALAGLAVLYKQRRSLFFAITITLIVCIYVFSSWWCWSYAACFGMRVMIDLYGILCIPLAALFSFMLSLRKSVTITIYGVIILFTALNMFQCWQYSRGLIHFDCMTKEAYCKGFLQTTASDEWFDLLKPYDFDRRKKGLPQIEYSADFFKNLEPQDLIYLRACCNLEFVSVNNPYRLAFCGNELEKQELFRITHLGGDTVALQSLNGNYLSVKQGQHNMIVADMPVISATEKFVMRVLDNDDNRIALQACNGKFMSVMENKKDLIVAKGNNVGVEETFRLYLLNTN